ncbi:hypothetical protein FZC83_02000 [Rossellomorea marisflavi]|uniref:Uncharacterized protein n=1 Tax=Rossellomorea marisflavi TaxID=189381 RepID=A0A5D4S2I1_9BACI|nr:hypothetical protein [Rossellomorea marisflavi]TYS56368.1 hypothetical protein FZC83_02000 [Rossellomorea marisflavi]
MSHKLRDKAIGGQEYIELRYVLKKYYKLIQKDLDNVPGGLTWIRKQEMEKVERIYSNLYKNAIGE